MTDEDEYEPMTQADVDLWIKERDEALNTLVDWVNKIEGPPSGNWGRLTIQLESQLFEFNKALMSLRSRISAERWCKYQPPRVKKVNKNGP